MQRNRLSAVLGAPARAALLALCAGTLFAGSATAQQQEPGSGLPTPQLLALTPPGGKAGTVVEVTVTGLNLEDPEALLFSQTGLKAEPIIPPPPPPPDPKKPPAPPAPKTSVTQFKVTIPADTPPGLHDVRLVNRWGVSNPRAFVVGDLPEVQEKEPNNNDTEAQKVPLNCTINGTIATPADVDYYVFPGTKGQRVVLSCLALSIDSRMQPDVELYDSKGKPLAANYRYERHRLAGTSDAVTDCVLPEDGDYTVRVSQFTYSLGDPQHFYRLTISTAPWIDAVYPPCVEPGKPAQLTVYGRNLPDGKLDPTAVIDGRVLEKVMVTVNAPAEPAAGQRLASSGYLAPNTATLDGFEYRLRNPTGTSNPYLLTYAHAPVVLDNEANDTPETAQALTLPCEVAGRIEKRGDRDWYTFTAKKGDVCNIEVISDRLGAPTDMYFLLRNPATKQLLIEADDSPEVPSIKFYSRSEDPPIYRFVAPADGPYELMVSSRLADNLAGPHHLYLVRITPEEPDFRLVVMPADFHRPDSCCLLQGGNESFTVFAYRRDGFTGDIQLGVEGLPKGVTCAPQTLAAGLRETTLVVSAAADAPAWTGTVAVKGTAVIKGQNAVREARPASITWPVQPQGGVPAISRLDRALVLAVRDKAPYSVSTTLDKGTLVQGEKATLSVKVTRIWPDFKAPLAVKSQVADLPPGNVLNINNNAPINIAPGADTGTLTVTVAANAPPGTYNLVLRTQAQVPYNKDPMAKQKQPTLIVLPSTPVTLTVLPKSIATVTANVPNGNVKVGAQTDVAVKVARLFDYDGAFKVELVLPAGVKGVSAEDVTIPAGADEAKLVLKVAGDAALGARSNLTVRVTGMVNGKVPTAQEAKININVVK